MSNTPIISIVSPVYKAKSIIKQLVELLKTNLNDLDVTYEIILVDDRCPDNSWETLKQLAEDNAEVKSIRLSKNFGQHKAIMAGLSEAKGEWVVVMDCDLQDQPKEIKKLYHKALEGYDAVLAKRTNRQDGFLKKLSSLAFAKIYGLLTGTKFNNEIANFGIYNKKVTKSILKMGDAIKSFPLFNSWVGFNQTAIYVEHAERLDGKSSYSFIKLLTLAMDTIISFTNKPLRLVVKFGVFISLVAFIFGLHTLYLRFTDGITVLGYSSIIISIWFFSGIIITTIGIIGIYIGKIFNQTKNRPYFIIDEIYENE